MSLSKSILCARRLSQYVLLGFVAYFVLAAGLAARWYGTTEATIVCSGCLAVAVAICLCLRLSDDKRRKIALAISAVLFSLYVCESFFAIATSMTGVARADAQPVGDDFDHRSISQVLEDMRKTGTDAVPTVAPEMFTRSNGLVTEDGRIFPVGGMARKRTLLGNENGDWAHYESDQYGFNNPPHDGSEVDVVLIGDSFAQGVAVHPGEDIASRLRASDRRVANLGTSGNGPLIELATLKEYAEPLKPLVVLWFYYEENDLFNLRNERQSELLMQYLDPEFSQGLRSRQREIDGVLQEFIQTAATKRALDDAEAGAESSLVAFAKLSHLRKLARVTYQRQSWRQDKADLVPHFSEIMEHAKSRTESWGGKLYFVYLPCWNRYGGVASAAEHYHRDEVLKCVEELAIPTIDVHDEIGRLDDPLSVFPFRSYGHYNASGYELVAKQIHQVITPAIAELKSRPSGTR